MSGASSGQRHILQQLQRGWALGRIGAQVYIYPVNGGRGALVHTWTVNALQRRGYLDANLNLTQPDTCCRLNASGTHDPDCCGVAITKR